MASDQQIFASGSATSDHTFGKVALSCTPGGRLDKLCAELRQEFPLLTMQHKSAHWYWIVLHWLLLIVTFGGNRKFNDLYTTTIGMLIGFSDSKWKAISTKAAGWEDRVWALLQHEREHLRQFKRYGLFPMLVLYVFVFFPIGFAYFRARFERAGYERTLQCWYALNRHWAEDTRARDWWVKQFTGGAYGWAWPFKKTVGEWFDRELKRLQAMTAEPTFS